MQNRDHFSFEVISGIGQYEERIIKIDGDDPVSRGEWMKFVGYDGDLRVYTKMGEAEAGDAFSAIAMENSDKFRTSGINNFHKHVITKSSGVIAALGAHATRLECMYEIDDDDTLIQGDLEKGDELAVVGGKIVKYVDQDFVFGTYAGTVDNRAFIVLNAPLAK